MAIGGVIFRKSPALQLNTSRPLSEDRGLPSSLAREAKGPLRISGGAARSQLPPQQRLRDYAYAYQRRMPL